MPVGARGAMREVISRDAVELPERTGPDVPTKKAPGDSADDRRRSPLGRRDDREHCDLRSANEYRRICTTFE